MKLVFVTNYINHHQVYVADEFYKILGNDYTFIVTEEIPEWRKKLGYPVFSSLPYLLNAYSSEKEKKEAIKLVNEADVVIIGSAPEEYVIDRIKLGKLTFRYSERFFKSRPWYLTGPRGWLSLYRNHIRYKNKPLYMLAASAYTANDMYAIGAYKNKIYKWGYFTAVSANDLEYKEFINPAISFSDITLHLMWCARFLKWKHPELPVLLAERLKKSGYRFSLDMYGIGEELESTIALTKKIKVEDVVNFYGSLPNGDIIDEMKRHDIFLFTSDRNEGWGAVLNESMGYGCAVVVSDKVGSAPFLVKDGVNGFMFESGNLESLFQKVKRIFDDRQLCKFLSSNAQLTMCKMWNPGNAAERFLRLVEALQNNQETPFEDGPCSKALPYK